MTGPARSVPLIIRLAVPWAGALLIMLAAVRIGGPVAAVIGGALTVGLALLTIRLLGRHDWPAAGLPPWPKAWPHLLLGFLGWLVPCTVMVIIGALSGWLRFAPALPPGVLGVIAIQVAVAVLAQALPQELIFRSAIFAGLSERFGGWTLILLQGVLYGAFLFLAGGLRDPLGAGFGIGVGIALGFLRAITGSVWAPVGMHLAYRLATGLIGTADPGLVTEAPGLLPGMLIFGAVPFAVALTFGETLVRIIPGLSAAGRVTKIVG
ncbi:CPBP family intramembrane glutamic endopeptidase [Microlunatus speluncae]|uniref:CPBP family intramembrane glutamic endopeptidase n=1 Tax=Microlunatus speluncae TaxID=2594267 RepID=UPI0012660B13|nr:CPBP family intramembrane glutamic endopeptidase [Microlunatus speluncae]